LDGLGLGSKQTEETLREALAEAPTVYEVLARPESYKQWYDGQRKEALRETGEE
jgi:hypothetical protein